VDAIGIGQGAPRHVAAKAGVVELGAEGTKTGLDVGLSQSGLSSWVVGGQFPSGRVQLWA
jgi:hypothetical protein